MGQKRGGGFPKSVGGKVRGGGQTMVLTSVRANATGAIGVPVIITSHPYAHGGTPPEGIGARHPRSAARTENHPISQSRRRLRPRARERSILAAKRPRQSFSTTSDAGGVFSVSAADSVVVLDTGATANLEKGRRKVSTYTSSARFRFGGGRRGEVRRAADILVGIAGNKGKITAFALGADIPALLGRGAMGALRGQLDFPRDALALRRRGAAIPLRVNRMGRFTLSAVDFGKGESRKVRSPVVSASYPGRASAKKRPNLSNGGLHLPNTNDGSCHFGAPSAFPACKAVALGDASGGCLSDPRRLSRSRM